MCIKREKEKKTVLTAVGMSILNELGRSDEKSCDYATLCAEDAAVSDLQVPLDGQLSSADSLNRPSSEPVVHPGSAAGCFPLKLNRTAL